MIVWNEVIFSNYWWNIRTRKDSFDMFRKNKIIKIIGVNINECKKKDGSPSIQYQIE